ncbi:unnamed protein product, partial [Ectocarpus fasciculatus]
SRAPQAHRCAQGAEDAVRKGDHAEATELHLAAARDFLRAAEQARKNGRVQEHGVLASSLLLLADSHAARAEKGAIRLRLSGEGRGSLNSSLSSSRDLTPAEAYRAAATGVKAAGKGDGRRENVVGRGDGRSSHSVGPDMDDSIMRGTAATGNAVEAKGGGVDAAAELAKKFRPQRDDLLELERQLAKLGLESKMGGPGGRARQRHPSVGAPQLSSPLGDSFFFLNKSVIFGGPGTGGNGLVAIGGPANAYGNGNGPAAGIVLGSPGTRLGVATSPGGGGGRSTSAPRRFNESDASPEGEPPMTSGRRTRADGRVADGAQGGGNGADRPLTGGGGAWTGESVGGGGGGGEGRPASVLSSAEEEARRAREEEAQQGEIMRLLTCLKTLGDENVFLMKECEDRDKASASTAVRQESKSIREEMKRFQLKYHERFTLLKKTLDEVMRSYPQLAAPGTASAAGGASTSDPAKTAEEVQRLTQTNRKLTEQVKKYENYYKELCLKAESKRKEQLSQAKAARQQQLAHHPSFSQQQQQQQQAPQQQQQQQRVQRRLSPAPAVPRRTQQQQQQQQQQPSSNNKILPPTTNSTTPHFPSNTSDKASNSSSSSNNNNNRESS